MREGFSVTKRQKIACFYHRKAMVLKMLSYITFFGNTSGSLIILHHNAIFDGLPSANRFAWPLV